MKPYSCRSGFVCDNPSAINWPFCGAPTTTTATTSSTIAAIINDPAANANNAALDLVCFVGILVVLSAICQV